MSIIAAIAALGSWNIGSPGPGALPPNVPGAPLYLLGWGWTVAGPWAAFAVVTILLAACLARMRYHNKMLRQLAGAMRIAALGNLQIELPASSQSVRGQLIRAFRELLQQLQHLVDARRRMSQEIVLRNRFELKLRQAKDAVEAASKDKDRIIAGLSVEMRTSLRSIVQFCSALLDEDCSSLSISRLSAIRQEAERLLHFAEELLDGEGVESGCEPPRREAFRLPRVTDAVAQAVRFEADCKGLNFQTQIDPDVPCRLIGDPIRLRHILYNLAVNAVTHTAKRGSVTLRVTTIHSDTQRAMLRLSIVDTGAGMPPDGGVSHGDAVEDGAPRCAPGLGPTLARRLVKSLGGRMGGSSEAGRGGIFWVELPFEIDASPEARADSSGAESTHAAPTFRGTALVAEDDSVSQTIVKMQLERLGIHVDTVDNGALAARAAERIRYDIIFMDINMPELDGIAATRRIRRERTLCRDTPIVGLTAGVEQSLVQACREAGMIGVLTKPARQRDLSIVLERWLPVREPDGTTRRPQRAISDDDARAPERDVSEPATEGGGASDDGTPIFDYETALRLFGGNSVLLDMAIRKLRGTSREQLAAMRTAHAEGNTASIRATAHKLKGGAACLTAHPVAETAATLESLATEEQLDGMESLFSRLDDQFQELENFLDAGLTS